MTETRGVGGCRRVFREHLSEAHGTPVRSFSPRRDEFLRDAMDENGKLQLGFRSSAARTVSHGGQNREDLAITRE